MVGADGPKVTQGAGALDIPAAGYCYDVFIF